MNALRIVLRRLIASLPLFLFLPLVMFAAMQFLPGNYFDSLRMDPQISKETVAQYENLYHLNEPFWTQYSLWLKSLARLDFGYSFAYKRPVLELLASRLGNTLLLTCSAFALAWFFAVVLGLLAGLRPGGPLDRICGFVAYSALSIPGFFLCLLFLYVALQWTNLPLGGIKSVDHHSFSGPEKILDILRHMVIPVAALALGSFAHLFRIMRAQTLEIKDRDFVFFLRASRVPEHRIIFKHIARNAMNPMISLLGLELPALFSGAALVEIFTGWPGLGQMMLQAVRSQDLFLVLGNMIMIAALLTAGNLLADLLLTLSDPRIRFEKRAP